MPDVTGSGGEKKRRDVFNATLYTTALKRKALYKNKDMSTKSLDSECHIGNMALTLHGFVFVKLF